MMRPVVEEAYPVTLICTCESWYPGAWNSRKYDPDFTLGSRKCPSSSDFPSETRFVLNASFHNLTVVSLIGAPKTSTKTPCTIFSLGGFQEQVFGEHSAGETKIITTAKKQRTGFTVLPPN
jgi:hypothetical protein